MSDFMAKMHEIRLRLGLHPRPRWGILQRSPSPLAGFKGAYFSANLFTVDSRDLRGLLLRGGRVGQRRGWRGGKGGRGRSTCLTPRFDNPGYGPVSSKCRSLGASGRNLCRHLAASTYRGEEGERGGRKGEGGEGEGRSLP